MQLFLVFSSPHAVPSLGGPHQHGLRFGEADAAHPLLGIAQWAEYGWVHVPCRGFLIADFLDENWQSDQGGWMFFDGSMRIYRNTMTSTPLVVACSGLKELNKAAAREHVSFCISRLQIGHEHSTQLSAVGCRLVGVFGWAKRTGVRRDGMDESPASSLCGTMWNMKVWHIRCTDSTGPGFIFHAFCQAKSRSGPTSLQPFHCAILRVTACH